MAKSETVSVPSTVSSPKTAPVGFTATNAARLADDTRALLAMWRAATEEKGDKRTRARESVKTLAACIVCDFTRDENLERSARGSRIGVEMASKLRGESTVTTQSLPIFDVIRALTFGGLVQGSGRLV